MVRLMVDCWTEDLDCAWNVSPCDYQSSDWYRRKCQNTASQWVIVVFVFFWYPILHLISSSLLLSPAHPSSLPLITSSFFSFSFLITGPSSTKCLSAPAASLLPPKSRPSPSEPKPKASSA